MIQQASLLSLTLQVEDCLLTFGACMLMMANPFLSLVEKRSALKPEPTAIVVTGTLVSQTISLLEHFMASLLKIHIQKLIMRKSLTGGPLIWN